jgi:hypothetical protein
VSAPPPTSTSDPYELDPEKHVIPDKPVTGRLKGKAFTPERIEIEGNRLILRTGKDFFADQEIQIFLDNQGKLSEGIKLTVKPSQKWADGIPSLHVSTRGKNNTPDTKFINDKYSMTLELGKPIRGQVQGKMCLCLLDTDRSYLAGTFVAQRKRSLSEPPGDEHLPYIQGSITPPAPDKVWVNVGYVGKTANGTIISNGTGMPASKSGGVRSTTFEPRTASLRFKDHSPQYDFTNLTPGRYLIFARYESGPTVWEWINVPSDAKLKVDLKLDTSRIGEVQFKVPAKVNTIRLIPMDLANGSLDDKFLDQLTYSMSLFAEAKDGVANLKLPASKYRVIAEALTGEIEILAGQMTTVELKAGK